MILQDTFTLSNGVKIPQLGLGTWMIEDANAAQAVRSAVEIGYRHIDSAQGYSNERGVGEGVRTCGLPREELFVTTKLEAAIKDYDRAMAAIDVSLRKLGIGYIDLMIIHSPQPWTDFREGDRFAEGNRQAWRALEDAHKAGKIRAIGLSNFQEADIDNILSSATVPPTVNQILAHISNTPSDLIDYCQQRNILVEAYSPIGHGELLKNRTVADIAGKYGVSVAQLAIRYCIELGLLPLPKTANPQHMRSNAAVDFKISDSDLDVLRNIERITNYGEASQFPVYGGKLTREGVLQSRDFFKS